MPEFTKEELSFISQVLTQVNWKVGQKAQLTLAEAIVIKCNNNVKPTSVDAEMNTQDV
jgi:hypothetical protein